MGIFKKIGMVVAVSMLLVACGDDSSTKSDENEQVYGPVSDADYEVYYFENLPNCTSKKEGSTGFVVESGEGYVCKSGDWVRDDAAVEITGSCSSEDPGLVDGSSSSDSGSVILQQCAAEFDGKYMGYEGSTYRCYEGFWNIVENPPEDTLTQVICLKTEDQNAPLYCYLDTAIWDSFVYEPDAGDLDYQAPVKITGGSIEGVAQKGPYLQGSTYRIIPLDGKTLKPVGDTLNESFNNSVGTYKFCDLVMPSQYAMIEASGYYRSELTGNKSNLQMTIGAIVDVQKGANINMLTNLEYERVKYLVQNEGYNIAGAKKRALTEVFAAFHIDPREAVDEDGNKLSAEQLDITKFGAANGALLAVSIMIQGAITNTEFDVKAMMKNFRDDIKEDGAWTGESARTMIADFAFAADSAGKLSDYRNNVQGWNLSGGVPVFEQYINDFWASEYGIGKCTEDRFGTIKKNQNAASAHKENYFLCEKLSYRRVFERPAYVWDYDEEKYLYLWREIGEFERNTRNQVCNVNGLVIPGNIDKDKYYICDNGWREATGVEVDKYYTECTTDGKLNRFSDGYLYMCSNDEFVMASALDSALGIGCVSYLDGKSVEFKNAIHTYTCLDGDWNVDEAWALGNCTKDGKIRAMRYGGATQVELYVCDADTFRVANALDSIRNLSNHETFVDSRDGKTYMMTTIGTQTWMAENLNYEYNEGTVKSHCYENSADSCAKYGRLYTWAAAMDSAAVFSSAGKGCGYYGETCSISGIVRGVCPEGWHLPSEAEFETLMDAVGDSYRAGRVLKSTTGWAGNGNGSDAYGFSALAAGGYATSFWSASGSEGRYAYYLHLNSDRAYLYYDGKRDYAFSVRCVQD